MANTVNRNLVPTDPTQGRRRECARRKRQMARQREKELVRALHALPTETVVALATTLDDAQCGYVEHAIEQADLQVDLRLSTPEAYARALLAAERSS